MSHCSAWRMVKVTEPAVFHILEVLQYQLQHVWSNAQLKLTTCQSDTNSAVVAFSAFFIIYCKKKKIKEKAVLIIRNVKCIISCSPEGLQKISDLTNNA